MYTVDNTLLVIGRNKRPVERTVEVVRLTVAHCCENIASLIKKFNLPMRVLSSKNSVTARRVTIKVKLYSSLSP